MAFSEVAPRFWQASSSGRFSGSQVREEGAISTPSSLRKRLIFPFPEKAQKDIAADTKAIDLGLPGQGLNEASK